MYNAAPYNATPYNQAPAATAYQPSWQLALEVSASTVQPSWPLRLAVIDTVQPSWQLALAVVDPALLLAARSHAWQYRARLDGVDITPLLAGPMSASGEAGLAAVARFSIRPQAGVVTPAQYVDAEVVLDYLWRSEDGAVEQFFPLFVGRVDTVDVDPATFKLTLTCSDRRNDILAAGGAALLPGSRWSVGVFDAKATPLQQQEDRISTLCADFDLLPDGAPALTDWQAKVTPDWSFGAAHYVDGSLSVNYAASTEVVQRVEIDFNFRFWRLRLRQTQVDFVFGGATQMAAYPIAPPSAALITEALEATGLALLDEPVFQRLTQQWYNLAGTWTGYEGWENMVLSARAYLARRFAQSVTEACKLVVECGDTGIDPRRVATLSGALEALFDASAWERDPALAPVLPRPWLATESLHDALDDPATGRAEYVNAILTLLHQALRTIRASQRLNRVTFKVPLNPLVNRTHTVYFNAAGVVAMGKVHAVEHVLDPERGEAVTEITLALSVPVLPAPVPSALAAPTPPAAPAITPAQRQAHRLWLGVHVGGLATSAPYADTMQGYICNIPSEITVGNMITSWGYGRMLAEAIYGNSNSPPYAITSSATPSTYVNGQIDNPNFVAANAYPWQFRVIAPEVEPDARDHLTSDVAATYRVTVPADLFTVTAP